MEMEQMQAKVTEPKTICNSSYLEGERNLFYSKFGETKVNIVNRPYQSNPYQKPYT